MNSSQETHTPGGHTPHSSAAAAAAQCHTKTQIDSHKTLGALGPHINLPAAHIGHRPGLAAPPPARREGGGAGRLGFDEIMKDRMHVPGAESEVVVVGQDQEVLPVGPPQLRRPDRPVGVLPVREQLGEDLVAGSHL